MWQIGKNEKKNEKKKKSNGMIFFSSFIMVDLCTEKEKKKLYEPLLHSYIDTVEV
jgi:hypothetical protein